MTIAQLKERLTYHQNEAEKCKREIKRVREREQYARRKDEDADIDSLREKIFDFLQDGPALLRSIANHLGENTVVTNRALRHEWFIRNTQNRWEIARMQ